MNKQAEKPCHLPLFFLMTGGLLLAVFLYLSISLQFVDVYESCSAESLSETRGYVLCYSVAATLLFAGAALRPRMAIFLFPAAGTLLIAPALSLFPFICGHECYGFYPLILFSFICGHESYGFYPLIWLAALILWWIMTFIFIGTRN